MRLVRPRRAGRLVYYAIDDQHILELMKQAMTHVEELGNPATRESGSSRAEGPGTSRNPKVANPRTPEPPNPRTPELPNPRQR
jgi:hypothetical protein